MPQKKGTPSRQVTVADVARLADVSTGAVSAVLNGRARERGIGENAANRIRDAARRLGYKPNISARLMRRGAASQPLVVALITSFEAPEGVLGHAMSLIRHLRDTRQKGNQTIQVVIEMFSVGQLRELPGLLAGSDFNLAVITNTVPEDDEFLAAHQFSYPVIMLNRHIPGLPGVVDSPLMGEEAARILARRGHKSLAVLHGRPETQAALTRKNSFLRAAAELTGTAPREIIADRLSQEAGFRVMTEFLQHNEPPDALYCVMDTLAIGAYRAIRNAGLRIPDDIAVVGVGDDHSSLYLEPPLSTVGPNHGQAMKALGEMLLRGLADQDLLETTVVEVPVETHLRESTGD